MDLSTLVRHALHEDVGPGDLTTEACVDAKLSGEATITAKDDIVVCGHGPAQETSGQTGAEYIPLVPDGAAVERGTVIARVSGTMHSLLIGERVALNFLMRLSGIATHTRSAVARAGGLKVVDTRKTTPLHRALEKHAVRMGGASNHRFALYDAVLIKENHIRASGSVAEAVSRAQAAVEGRFGVQVEVETLEELEEALKAGADAILLDNMDDATLARAVKANAGRALLEASGGITSERLPMLAGLGLDRVSMGGLIHQARWVDFSMIVVP